jgi:hypothetical protein
MVPPMTRPAHFGTLEAALSRFEITPKQLDYLGMLVERGKRSAFDPSHPFDLAALGAAFDLRSAGLLDVRGNRYVLTADGEAVLALRRR